MSGKYSDRTQVILKPVILGRDSSPIPADKEVEEALELLEDFKYYLTTGPANWLENQIIRRYHLNNDLGFVSCVFWNNMYYMTGTDIVKCCKYRMKLFGRVILQSKKFEEGIFSDLRNLKCDIDATLEQPKSEFLQFLLKNSCLKTQKKQKVFFWFSIPHDKIFSDALERDLKREQSGQPPITKAISEPATSFNGDPDLEVPYYEQIVHHITFIKKRYSNPECPSNLTKEVDNTDAARNKDIGNIPSNSYSDNVVSGLHVSHIPESMGYEDQSSDNISKQPEESQYILPYEKGVASDYLNFEIEYPEGFAPGSKVGKVRFQNSDYSNQDVNQVPEKIPELQNNNIPQLLVDPLEGNENLDKSHPIQTTQCSGQYETLRGCAPGNIEVTPQILFSQANSMPVYFNVVPPQFSAFNPFESDNINHSVNQQSVPLGGIFSPQNMYGKDNMFRTTGANCSPVSQFPYGQPAFPNGIQNPATPGFRNSGVYPWVQSPFLPVGNIIPGNMFFPPTTPIIRSSRSNQVPGISKSTSENQSSSKVRKVPYSERDKSKLAAKAVLQELRKTDSQ